MKEHSIFPDLVDMMFLTKLIIRYVHRIEHTDDLHGAEPRTHRSEANDIAEQDGDTGELLAGVEGGFPITQLVSDGFGYHLIKKLVCSLNALLELGTANLLLWREK